uniref:Tudor domain-containing protein n=1 Tax=Eptatretus burgeri TaxID=7764 RepID=A0A8C4RC79_EPTBU
MHPFSVRLEQKLGDWCASCGQPAWNLDYKCGSLCAFEDLSCHRWFRCCVINENLENGKVQIQYIDYGTKKWVSVSQLHQLGEHHMQLPAQAVACRLTGIKPTGGTETWTATANDFTREELTGQSCLAVMKGAVTMDSGEPTRGAIWLVDLFVNDGDAKQSSFACELVQQGLAFSARTESSEWLVPPLTLTNLVSGNAKRSWTSYSYPPPISPPSLSFPMVVTSIDEDCNIFGKPRGVEKALQSLMAMVQMSIMELELDVPKSQLMDEYNWQPNQACLVKFSDGHWHRATIIHVLSGAVRIQYVDTGASEDIPFSHVIITNLFTDIPPLCLKISLHGNMLKRILWPNEAEAHLRSLLVGNTVDVSLQSLNAGDEGSFPAKVLFDGSSIWRLLAHRHLLHPYPSLSEDSETESSSEVDDEGQDMEMMVCTLLIVFANFCLLCTLFLISFKAYLHFSILQVLSPSSKIFQMTDYLPMELPALGEAFFVCVSHIDLPNQLFVRHFKESEFRMSGDAGVDESPDSSLSELNRKLLQIDAEAFNRPPLDDWDPDYAMSGTIHV